MPLYLVTQTRTFRERFVVEADDADDATDGPRTELWSESELGVTSDLEAETIEEITDADLENFVTGRGGAF